MNNNDDDQPIADDLDNDAFYDEVVDSAAEEAPVDESLDESGWDDEPSDEEEAAPEEPAARKKSSPFIYAGIGLVVLAVAGIGLMAMSRKDPVPPVASADEAEAGSLAALRDDADKESQLPVVTPDPAPETPPPTAEGFMNQPEPPAPAPAPAAPIAAAPPLETPPPAAQLPLGDLKPVSDFPSVDLIKKAEAPPAQDTVAPAVTPPSSQQAPLSTPQEPSGQTPPQNKPPVIEAQTQPPPASPETGTSPQPSVSVSGRDKEIAALKKTVEDLQSKLATRTSSAAARPVMEPPATTPSEEKPVIHAAPSQIAAVPAEAKTVWELRSAQPGQAMLSRKGSSDIRTVTVGDSLPGLGRITSIEQAGTQWIVQGSLGRVSQ